MKVSFVDSTLTCTSTNTRIEARPKSTMEYYEYDVDMYTNRIVEDSLIHLKMFIQRFNHNFSEKSQVMISSNLLRLYWFITSFHRKGPLKTFLTLYQKKTNFHTQKTRQTVII